VYFKDPARTNLPLNSFAWLTNMAESLCLASKNSCLMAKILNIKRQYPGATARGNGIWSAMGHFMLNQLLVPSSLLTATLLALFARGEEDIRGVN
jgi:hypothetical protein